MNLELETKPRPPTILVADDDPHIVELVAFRLERAGYDVSVAVLENLGYRQLNAWWRVRVLAEVPFRRKQGWGEMRRRGLGLEPARPARRRFKRRVGSAA